MRSTVLIVLWLLVAFGAAAQQRKPALDEAGLKSALEQAVQAPSADGANVLRARTQLIRFYQRNNRPQEAVALLQQQYADVAARSANTIAEADVRLDLAKQLRSAGRHNEAMEHALAAERIYHRELGDAEARSVEASLTVGYIHLNLGRVDEAVPMLEKAARQTEALFGPNDPRTAWAKARLGMAYRSSRRLPEAERLLLEAVKIYAAGGEKTARPYAATLGDLSAFYQGVGRLNEAEQYAQQSVTAYLQSFGPQWPFTIVRMRTLAEILIDQRRNQEALKILERALEFAKEHHSGTAVEGTVLSDLARVLQRVGQHDRAQALLQQAAPLLGKKEGEDSIPFANTQHRLGNSLMAQGNLAGARAAFEKAAEVYDRLAPGRKNPFFIYNRGRLELASKNYPAAIELLEQASVAFSEARGADHPDTAAAYNFLGAAYEAQGEVPRALDQYRLVAKALDKYLAQRQVQSAQARAEQEANLRTVLNRYLNALLQNRKRMVGGHDASAEAFTVVEQLRNRATQSAILGMSARAAVGDPELAQLVRVEQDLRRERGAIEEQLSEEVASGRAGKAQAGRGLIDKRNAIDRQLADVSARIVQRFPKYANLVHPTAPTLSELRAVVPPDGAILSYLVRNQSTLLWVITHDAARLHIIPRGADALEKNVRQLRRSLDANVVTLDDLPAYDVGLAHELYTSLVAPAAAEIAGKTNLVVIPHGPLFSLPFAALVTAPPAAAASGFSEYPQTAWLGSTHTVSVSPSAISHVTLMKTTRAAQAERPFIGFGDPAFAQLAAAAPKTVQRNVSGSRDVQKLAPLPDTSDELRQIAKALGAADSEIYLRARATEQNVKKIPLERYRVVAFATHGLIAGDLDGLNEPALALTPPGKPTSEDDGLLTMSEVLGLKLNADWVVLSACNTASSDGTLHSDGLSGLTQAFFYAGSRALLVTLWPVESKSAQVLTTSLFAAVRDQPKLLRTQALATAQRAMMQGKSSAPEYSHPFFWAPFILVGDGGSN